MGDHWGMHTMDCDRLLKVSKNLSNFVLVIYVTGVRSKALHFRM